MRCTIWLSIIAVLLVSCSTQTRNLPTSTIEPTATSSPLPSATSLPATPTPEPWVRQTNVETVTDNAATTDGGNAWGGHQTRIVHTQDGIFTAYIIEHGNEFHKEWRLAQRQSDGTWLVIAHGPSGLQPVNLLASPDGTLHVIGWPSGVATMWSGKPENGAITMLPESIPDLASGDYAYGSAGTDANGDLCILSSTGGDKPVGWFNWACYSPLSRQWTTQEDKLDYRFCYTYVFPTTDGQLSLVSTRDVLWQALGYQQPAGEFDYVFNAFGFWHTDNISKVPLERVYSLEEKPTSSYPDPIANAQEDAYLDTKGMMHIIYHVQGESTQGTWISRQAIISPDGKVLFDVQLPSELGDYSRIFQDNQGWFYLLGSSGKLYTMDQDGVHVGNSIQLDLKGNSVEYSGFGLSVPRTGTPLSDTMDVVFPSDSGTKWLYFQLDFSGQ